MELLALPQPPLLAVFGHLSKLDDACALSATCTTMHELGRSARQRYYSCAACGHRIFDPAAALSSASDGPCLRLQDGTALGVEAQHLAGARLSPEGPSQEWHLRCSLAMNAGVRQALEDPEFVVRTQQVYCGGCGLYLGTRITALGDLAAAQEESEEEEEEEEEGAPAAGMSQWRLLAVLGRCFLVHRYLRMVRADGSEDRCLPTVSRAGGAAAGTKQLSYYCCTGERSPLHKQDEGCGAVLCDIRAVLSREHRWDAGGGAETAYYINALLPGSVVTCNEREETLCQGTMVVADVYCTACAARIGWRFCRDLETTGDNENQVGRWGLVKSSLAKKSAAALGLGAHMLGA